ncbi:MAG: N-acetylneuraminate synthase family protein, partial [Deltaproteobacteria bacterium]|nr:N-acetylneuraminate synthase family protein [Deltaproteobacteria bacterium]
MSTDDTKDPRPAPASGADAPPPGADTLNQETAAGTPPASPGGPGDPYPAAPGETGIRPEAGEGAGTPAAPGDVAGGQLRESGEPDRDGGGESATSAGTPPGAPQPAAGEGAAPDGREPGAPGPEPPQPRAEVSQPQPPAPPQQGARPHEAQQPAKHNYGWRLSAEESRLPYLILDIGANPSGSRELAADMVRAAAAAGAPAVKFQAFKVTDLIHPENKVYREMQAGEMPHGLIEDMAKLAHDLGMQCGVTVFSPEGIDRALACKADFIKIASGDINYLALIREAANAGPPLILSTGASTSKDVRRVLGLLNSMAKRPAAILQCTSLYPAPATSCYLAVMAEWLSQGLPAGFSDHSMGVSGPLFAYALGAVTVEKHFTTDRTLPGGDNFMSLLPEHVSIITGGAKSAMPPAGGPLLEAAARESLYYGQRIKRIFHGEDRRALRRVACAARRLPKGTALRTHNLKFLRLGSEVEGRFLGPGSPYK